jgi:hypothetical protein
MGNDNSLVSSLQSCFRCLDLCFSSTTRHRGYVIGSYFEVRSTSIRHLKRHQMLDLRLVNTCGVYGSPTRATTINRIVSW